MYHNQQPTDGGSPSPTENHRANSYSLATLISSLADSDTIIPIAEDNFSYLTTTNSVYADNFFLAEDDSYQLDDLIDEMGEAEDDRFSVGMEGEESASSTGTDIFSLYFGAEDDDYAALEPPPQDLYVQGLLETEIDVLKPYDPRLKLDVAGDGFYVSYYNSKAGAENVVELEAETEEEPLFTTVSAPAEDAEPEEEANSQSRGDLESRLGFRKSA